MAKKISYSSMVRVQPLSNFPFFDVSSDDRAFLDKERVKPLEVAREAVLKLMLDGEWHSLDEIRAVGGSSGDRRLRELASVEFGEYVYEKTRVPGSDEFLYRFVGQRVRNGEDVEMTSLQEVR